MQISSLSPSSHFASPPAPSSSDDDPLLPRLQSIANVIEDFKRNPIDDSSLTRYKELLRGCIDDFSTDARYRSDRRLAEILGLYGDAAQDFNEVFTIMKNTGICAGHAVLYEMAGLFYIFKGRLMEAHHVYQLGISRNAQPLTKLRDLYSSLVEHCTRLVSNVANPIQKQANILNPWSPSSREEILELVDPELVQLKGYLRIPRNYGEKIHLSCLQKKIRNKIIKLGKRNYHIKGCAGQGGFASVFKACVDGNSNDVVALKVQQPACLWEFYMYRLLDMHISRLDRSCFGFAHRVHIYDDCSFLICNYLSHGTLLDAVNYFVVSGKCMEEILCMYYTSEMLRMLETLHNAGIIHGDFKADNLLVRHCRDDLTEDGFLGRTGPWSKQGLCLIDWGQGIDLNLYPEETMFNGDCKTSGFRCIQMQEKQPWKFQVDCYALCVNVHLMLHGQYMTVEKKITPEGGYYYCPKSPLRRYWNTDLWRNLFSALLNFNGNGSDVAMLRDLRTSFEQHICRSSQLIKLKDLLLKQKSLFSE